MRRIGDTSQTGKVEGASRPDAEGIGNEECGGKGEDLAASLEEIEKLDAVLRIKLTEEKKAKLSRIQTEEESRDVLRRLRSCKLPDKVKTNVEEFMKLLDEAADCSPDFKSNDVDGTGEEKRSNKEDGKDGKDGKASGGSLKFVERNIQLAKCGCGTLSLTDEEKSRIENLLVEMEGSEPKAAELPRSASESLEEHYAIDDQTKSVLGEIEQRLQALTKLKSPKESKSETYLLGKSGKEGNEGEDENGKRCSRVRGRGKAEKRGSRLEEINKLLNWMNSASDEEIIPLAEEDLGSLLEQSKEALGGEREEEGGEGGEGGRGEPKLSRQEVAELVSGAKYLMPKFKYRFDES